MSFARTDSPTGVFGKLSFSNKLNEKNGVTLLRFAYADWEAATEYFVSCNTTRGALMFRLKRVIERDTMEPLFS
jgi:hypothetical protein